MIFSFSTPYQKRINNYYVLQMHFVTVSKLTDSHEMPPRNSPTVLPRSYSYFIDSNPLLTQSPN